MRSSAGSSPGARVRTRARTVMWCARRRSCWRRRACPTRRWPSVWACPGRRCRSGESGSSIKALTAWRSARGLVARDLFPPLQIAEVKALACELPAEKGVPLSRWSSAELAREAVARGIVERISGVIVWRWLSADAIRPWNYRSWIFPRDPQFREKAGRILDLYEGRWEGQLLEPGDFVVCADEKPSIQARARKHPTAAAKPKGDGQLVEHEYDQRGALCYLAAWDVRHARIFDRCAPADGNRAIRRAGRAVHEHPALRQGPARVPGRRQRLRTPRQAVDQAAAGSLEEPHRRPHPGARLMG